MEAIKPDYMKLRRIYEQSGNVTALDQLVKHYLANEIESSNCAVEVHPFLKGITIAKEDIPNLNNTRLLCCIIIGAEPHEKLIEEALRAVYRGLEPTVFLYKRKMITFGQLLPPFVDKQKRKHSYDTIEGIKQLFDLENRDDYKDLNLKELELLLVSCCDELSYLNYCSQGLPLELKFLTTLPYNDGHLKIVQQAISKMTTRQNEKLNTRDLESIMINYLRPIFVDLRGNDLIELIHSRPDYTTLFIDNPIFFLRSALLRESSQEYDALMDNIYYCLCVGGIDRISFALELFPKLQERTIELVNYWARHDMTLEVDVYGMPLLQEEDYDPGLDDKYMAAKQKAKETSKESFTMKPIDPKKPQE